MNDNDHPFNIKKPETGPNVRASRSRTAEILPTQGFSNLTKNTFINDGIKAWNLAPKNVKECTTYSSAKLAIKKFVKTLPI